jgi:DMSO/TMAO reductase YedYZ heme-binding membrane subunit
VTAGVTVHINPNLPWYIARSGGIVAWALIAATVIWGLAFSGKLTRHPKLPSPAWMLDLHRFLGGLAVIFTGLHIAGLMTDKFVGYGPFNVLVPFTGAYRPAATAWGIVAMYLLVSVELTSLVMTRLPRKVWHGIHMSSYVIFTLATIHGLTTGTDARHGILPLVMVLTAIVVAMLTGMRVQIGIAKRTERAQRAQRAQRVAPRRDADGDAAAPARPVRERPARTPAPEAAVADAEPAADELPVRARPVRARPEHDRPLPERAERTAALPAAARSGRSTADGGPAPEPRPTRVLPAREPVLTERGPRRERPVEEVAAQASPAAPAVAYADPGYAPAATLDPRHPGDGYADPRLPAPGYPDPRVPAPGYAGPPVPRPTYGDRGPTAPGYPAPGYGEPGPGGAPFPDPRQRPPGYDDPRLAPPGYGDPRYGDPRYGDPRYGDPRLAPPGYDDPRLAPPGYGDPRYADPRYQDPRLAPPGYADPRYADPRYHDPRLADPRLADPRLADPRLADPRLADPRLADPRLADPRLADPRLAGPRHSDPRFGPPAAYPSGAYPPPAYPPPGGGFDPRGLGAPPATPIAPPQPLAISAPYAEMRPPAPAAPVPPAGPGVQSRAPRPPAYPSPQDDDIEDAEIVEDAAEAVGQTSAVAPHRDAIVYPLRPYGEARVARRGGGDGHAPAAGGHRFSPAVTSATPASGRGPEHRSPRDAAVDRATEGSGSATQRPVAPGPRPSSRDGHENPGSAVGEGPDDPSQRVPGRLP